MERLKSCGHHADLQVLDNEVSAAYQRQITNKWKADFQLVPPNIHRRNTAERAIRPFKAHFLAILEGVAPDYPPQSVGCPNPKDRDHTQSAETGPAESCQIGVGKSGATPASIARKWALNVRIARSAVLRRCMFSGTSWKSAFHLSVICCRYSALASLSSTWRSTWRPRLFSLSIIVLYATNLWMSFLGNLTGLMAWRHKE